MPVARDIGDATAPVRRSGMPVRGAGVKAGESGQLDRPVIVIELARKEERSGEAVVLRAVVAVVLVGGDGVASEAAVLAGVTGSPL